MASCCVFVVLLLSISAVTALSTVPYTPFKGIELRGAEYHNSVGGNCGDNICSCSGSSASCGDSHDGVTYIPKLPVNISALYVYLRNDLNPDRLTKDFFTNVSGVIDLTLRFCNLTHVPYDTFGVITNLTRLQLYSDPISDINSTRYLLSIPSLKVLGGNFGRLQPGSLYGLDSHVTGLFLNSRDGIQYNFNLTQFVPLKRLEVLYLTMNSITGVTLDNPIALQQLILSHNDVAAFPITCMYRRSLFPDLENLDLSLNVINYLPGQFCLPNLKILNLSRNLLLYIESGTFIETYFSNLVMLVIGSQRNLYHVMDFAFNNSKLTALSLANNRLEFYGSDPNVYLRAFANCQNLTVLTLDGNNFEGVNDEIFQRLLGHLPLINLSLENCHLNGISEQMFAPFLGLQKLNLRGNKISTIPDGIFDLHAKLRVLDMSENKLSVVTKDSFSENTRRQLVHVLLGNNPFICSCDLLWFRNWLANNHSLFFDNNQMQFFYQYKCSNIPELNVDNFTMVQQACLLTRETSIQITVALSLIILTFTLFSLLFRYRWHFRLILHEGFRGRGDVRRLRLQTNNFDYDVFVSYASDDLPWVHEHLMPELEDRLGLRLCVHERDFIPGNNIVDNIANCVESSKKIMMVFSRGFVKSQWCQFELNFCLRHAMDHDDVLIIVCVDDVASRDMTTAMLAVLKTTTFIQWEQLNDAIDAFWGRVCMSLSEIMEPRRV